MNTTSTHPINFNGVNGSSGKYLFPQLTPEDIVKVALGEKLDPAHQAELKQKYDASKLSHFGVAEGIDSSKIAETGWGVIFTHDADPAIKDAIGELLKLRKEQASEIKDTYYKEYTGPDGYRPGESKQKFLARHGAGPGPAKPDNVPYYLLIVGSPEEIPYSFQYQLNVQYAVGRIHFDTLAQYAQYAQSVVAAETGKVSLAKKASFFGVSNPDDQATNLSCEHLVKPLSNILTERFKDWDIQTALGAEANKSHLESLLRGEDTPAVLFSASHGMGFDNGDSRQLPHQGALLCQDWPGPREWRGPIPQDHYLAGDDIGDDAKLLGMMAFCFACYGAGTPQRDEFAHQAFQAPERSVIAPHAFLAQLPQRLLSHPKGGALAVIGHVERAWGYSFMWERAGQQIEVFNSSMQRLLAGKPVGAAMEYFNMRHAELAADLTGELEEIKFGREADEMELSSMWTSHNDARSYVIIGDPAVRLPLSKDKNPTRPALNAVHITEPNKEMANIETPFSPGDNHDDEQQLRFPVDDCEARHKENMHKSQVSFGDLQKMPPAFLNSCAQLEKRLKRIGMPEADIKKAIASMKTASATDHVSFAVTSNTIPTEELPEETTVGLERILGRNELMSVAFLNTGAFRSKSIGRIVIKTSATEQSGYGTGFLIWPKLLMTNNHVIKNEKVAAFSRVQFNYECNSEGKCQPPIEFELDPDTFYITSDSKDLDFTLVALKEKSIDTQHELSEFGGNWLNEEEDGDILIGESVNIIQHPNGEPKQLALRENDVTGKPENKYLHYKTDTAPGSSGSPVYNDQWELIALHHSGVPKRNEAGKILTIDGGIWKSSMGEHKVDWIANEGIRVAAICAFLKEADLSDAQKEMVKHALTPPNGSNLYAPDHHDTHSNGSHRPTEQADTSPTKSGTNPTTILQSAPVAARNGNSVSLEIPLKITVELGSTSIAQNIHVTLNHTPSPVAPTDTIDHDEIEDEAVVVDQDYSNRKGYDPNFLGRSERRIPLPGLSKALEKKAAINQEAKGANKYELKYHHYSVVMNKKRKLAFFSAVNVHGGKIVKVTRDRDRWYFDPRISRSEQIGAPVYKRNPLDKGHLVRRLDGAWGDTEAIARAGSDDTFHWTNCAPQHAEFNRSRTTWLGIEDQIFKNANAEDLKVTVINGPILDESDLPYRGVNLPRAYYKVVAFVKPDKSLSASAFLLSQEALIKDIEEEFSFGKYKVFQVPITQIEEMTGLSFHHLSEHDALNEEEPTPLESSSLNEITSFDDMKF